MTDEAEEPLSPSIFILGWIINHVERHFFVLAKSDHVKDYFALNQMVTTSIHVCNHSSNASLPKDKNMRYDTRVTCRYFLHSKSQHDTKKNKLFPSTNDHRKRPL